MIRSDQFSYPKLVISLSYSFLRSDSKLEMTSLPPSVQEDTSFVAPVLELARADINLLIGVLNAVTRVTSGNEDGELSQTNIVNYSKRKTSNSFLTYWDLSREDHTPSVSKIIAPSTGPVISALSDSAAQNFQIKNNRKIGHDTSGKDRKRQP
uniref:Uncharacterized protein n=1 Tax=Caenorhabditis japonica TaxID=281687 RepID=A0A8R1IFD6_CAEJA